MKNDDDKKSAVINPFSGQPVPVELFNPFKDAPTPTSAPTPAPTPGDVPETAADLPPTLTRAAGVVARIVASTAGSAGSAGAGRPVEGHDARTNALPSRIRRILETPLAVFEALKNEQAAAGTQPLTYVGFVLDRSGSMQTGKAETIAGFNAQIEVIKAETATAGETRLGMVDFADVPTVRYMGQGLSALTALTDENYKPGGYTALFDGIGVMIAELLAQARMESPETAVLVTIFTDGEENASRVYSSTTLKALITRLEATGRWTFALVGPGATAMNLADLLAVDRSNVAGFDPDSVDSRGDVMIAMKLAGSKFMNSRSRGLKSSKGLYKDEKES